MLLGSKEAKIQIRHHVYKKITVLIHPFPVGKEEELFQIDFKSKKDSQKDFTKGGISNQTDFFSKNISVMSLIDIDE